jgi:Flp pilus assembly protein TadD
MANAEGITPSRHEVERQLERMASDPLFQARPKQTAIFEYLVKSALDRTAIDEKTIFAEFFTDKRYAEGTTSVRTTVSHIRTLIAEYYAGDGQHDPVVIALPAPERSGKEKKNYRIVRRPEGKAYTPSFSYNPASWIAKELAIAHHLLRGGPAQIEQALEHFRNVQRAEPDHPEAMLGLIEAWGTILMIGGTDDPDRALSTALLSMLDATEKRDGASWQTHSLRALLHFIQGDVKSARSQFEKALKLNRQATVSRGWYVQFLFKTGHEEQAVRLIAAEADERADRAPLHALHGVYLTTAHRHEEAARAFDKSLKLDRNCWLAHFGLTKMYLALGNQARADEHAKRLESLTDPSEISFFQRDLHRH